MILAQTREQGTPLAAEEIIRPSEVLATSGATEVGHYFW